MNNPQKTAFQFFENGRVTQLTLEIALNRARQGVGRLLIGERPTVELSDRKIESDSREESENA